MAEEERETLADRVRKLREQQGLSQFDLAKRANTSPNQVYLIEAGKRKALRRYNLKRYAEALGTTESYLVFGDQLTDGEWPTVEAVLRHGMGFAEDQIGAVSRILKAFEFENQAVDEEPDEPMAASQDEDLDTKAREDTEVDEP